MRALLQKSGLDILAINDLSDTKTLAHLFKYDSVHRSFNGTVSAGDEHILVNGKPILVFAEKDPSNLPWKDLGIDVVIEATGRFTSAEGAGLHLKAGAKQVIISAPSSDREIATVVLGVNDHLVNLHAPILSNASCTTNGLAPMVQPLHEKIGIVNGLTSAPVSAIPEPETYAMMLAGLGMLGFASRRRKNK